MSTPFTTRRVTRSTSRARSASVEPSSVDIFAQEGAARPSLDPESPSRVAAGPSGARRTAAALQAVSREAARKRGAAVNGESTNEESSLTRETTPEEQLLDESRSQVGAMRVPPAFGREQGSYGSAGRGVIIEDGSHLDFVQGMNLMRSRTRPRPPVDATPQTATTDLETIEEEPQSARSFIDGRSFQTVEQPLAQNIWSSLTAKRRSRNRQWPSLPYAPKAIVLALFGLAIAAFFLSYLPTLYLALPPISLSRLRTWLPSKPQPPRPVVDTPSRDLTHHALQRLDELQTQVNSLELRYERLDPTNLPVDFLSLHLGSRVDDSLTSQTQLRPGLPVKQTFRSLLFGPPKVWANAPASALVPWFEQADCWCASLDKFDRPLSQLAIHAIVPFYPSSVTVEHVPRLGSLDISSAPKDVEFWIRVTTHEQWLALRRAYAAAAPEQKCSDIGPEGGDAATDTAFVCVGRFRYDIHGDYHVQHFRLPVAEPIQRLKILTNHIVVRATSNWGQKWTCMYRVRMHGEPMEGISPDMFVLPMV